MRCSILAETAPDHACGRAIRTLGRRMPQQIRRDMSPPVPRCPREKPSVTRKNMRRTRVRGATHIAAAAHRTDARHRNRVQRTPRAKECEGMRKSLHHKRIMGFTSHDASEIEFVSSAFRAANDH